MTETFLSNGCLPDVLHSLAFATVAENNLISCQVGFMEPSQGISLYEPIIEVELTIPAGCQGVVSNSWCGFQNVKVLSKNPIRLQADVKSAIWVMPTFEKSVGINVQKAPEILNC